MYFLIWYRLDSDPLRSKRYWEVAADSRESALSILSEHVLQKLFPEGPPLFPPKILILKIEEYLTYFNN